MTFRLIRRHVFTVLALGLAGLCGCGTIGSPCTPATQLEDCPLNAFCKVDEGNCDDDDAVGICTALAEQCTLEYAPVCGCDGETYGNACSADGAGVNIDHDGECDDHQGEACGGLQGLPCGDNEFCNYTDGSCGAADQTGICEDIPEFCPEIYGPVCGCDDQTYDNDCFAAAAGVSVASEGTCDEIVVRECGGLQGLQCDEGEFCNFSDANCGAADELGFCEVIPEACDDVFDPVCGCDDETYPNACEASAAGVSVASDGACPE